MTTRGDERTSSRRGPAIFAVTLAALLIGLLAYGLTASAPDDSIDSRLSEGRAARAPAFELPLVQSASVEASSPTLEAALDDRRLSISELRGAPVLLNFWASWCPPCRTEAPLLQKTWRDVRSGGMVVLGLNMQDVSDDAASFLDEFHIDYPNVRDGSDGVARRWGVAALPETFFIDRRGRVVGHVIGAISEPQLEQGIRAARSGRPLGRRSGGERRQTR